MKDISVNKGADWFESSVPPGKTNNAVNWLQKKFMAQAAKLPRDFVSLSEWESYKAAIRADLPGGIGVPEFPPMKESVVRARFRMEEGAVCERVDVYVDDDYAIPAFLFLPEKIEKPLTALVWSPGYCQSKFEPTCCALGVRGAKEGFAVLVIDHAPFGETAMVGSQVPVAMTLVMGMGHMLGYSQLGVRAAENSRAGEYLRSRPEIDPGKVVLSGLCQGGMDTYLSAALDDGFCAAAPICSASTFAIHMAEMADYMANADSSPFPFAIMKHCDVEHLHACIAPRPLLVRANLPDSWWPVSGLDAIEAMARRVYRLYGAESALDVAACVHEHAITGPFLEALLKFLHERE